MKRLCLAIVVAMLVQQPAYVFAQSDLQKEMQIMRQGKKQEDFIASFAQQAKIKDARTILQELDPSILKEGGDAGVENWLQGQIFPFFEKFAKMHGYKQITNAVMADGRTGLMHYTYIVDTQGKVQPFTIAVIDTADGPRILGLAVGKCIKGRHPICD